MPAVREKPKGKRRRGCGCAGIALVIGIVLTVIVYFLVRPLPVLPPETFLSQHVDAFLVVQVGPDDDAAKALLKEYVRAQADKMPLANQAAEGVDLAAPAHLVVSARHIRTEGEFAVGGVASTSGFGGFMRNIVKLVINDLRSEAGTVETFKGIEIGIYADGVCLAAVDNNFMLSQDKGMLKEWINRIEQQRKLGEGEVMAYKGPPAMIDMRGRLDPEAQVHLVSSNGHGEIKAFLDWVQQTREQHVGAEPGWLNVFDTLSAAEIDWSGVVALGGTLHILEADTGRCELLFQCRDEQLARELEGKAVSVLDERGAEAPPEEVRTTLEGTLLKVRFKTSGLQQMLQKAAEQGE